MRVVKRCYWPAALLVGLGVGTTSARAQGEAPFLDYLARGQTPNYEVLPDENQVPLPLSSTRPELGGLYLAGEFMYMDTNRALGAQTVAVRGLIDATGASGNPPGTLIGSGVEALNTDDIGRDSYQPGFRVTAGWKFENGWVFEASYLNLQQAKYTASASPIPPFFNVGGNLADSFLLAPVFNFPPQYNGPVGIDFDADGTPNLDTGLDATVPGTTVGLWNGADVMDIAYKQRFSAVDLTAKRPVFQSEYGRTMALGGARFAWFHENFWWRTTDYDVTNFAIPEWAVEYSSIISQRMYGPFVGCSHDVYLGDHWGLSFDLSVAALFDITKERSKYARADRANQAKRSLQHFGLVPNINAGANLHWYPFEGAQMRLGYSIMNFFNTYHHVEPIGFNFGAIDPVIEQGFFRYMQGFNVGFGVNF